MKRLLALYDDIERRARATTEAHPSWPCRRGCDHCCRHLAESPRITRAEWSLLEAAIARLEPETRAAVTERLTSESHRVCPLLDEREGACLVYEARPAACRTYGYYVERGEILGCSRILARGEDDVVWGNEEGVRQALATLSGEEARPLGYWLGPSASSPSSSM